jgi:acetyl-CoA carboxylase biotin carboxyl carrier protein
MNLTDEDVQEILRLLDQSPYGELKLETDRFKLTLKSSGQVKRTENRADKTPSPEEPEVQRVTSAAKVSPAAAHDGEVREIYPPLPGTFYRAPSPGAEAFTEAGKKVSADTILGLVETMKLMNSIMAGCNGEVVEVCAADGALVEVDDVLVRIRVSANG